MTNDAPPANPENFREVMRMHRGCARRRQILMLDMMDAEYARIRKYVAPLDQCFLYGEFCARIPAFQPVSPRRQYISTCLRR